MASPVDTSVKHWSTLMDGSAKPSVNGLAGTLIPLFDGAIAGFDSKACTINVVSGVATVTWSGTHSCTPDSVVTIAGATGAYAPLNGEQKIVAKVAGGTTATFATAVADGAATGSITIIMAPLPYWTKVFSGTNLAVYRSTDPAGTGMYLRIDDTPGTYVNVRAYEQMGDVNTGTNAFPTTAQAPTACWPKSTVANGTAQGWGLFADSRAIIFHPLPQSGTTAGANGGTTRLFGDFISLRTGGDPWACGLNYSTTTSVPSQYDGQVDQSGSSTQTAFPRPYTGLGPSQFHLLYTYVGSNAGVYAGSDTTLGVFPSPIDGMLRISKKYAVASGFSFPRAELPGYHHIPHSSCADSFRFGDKVVGTGVFAGRRFFVVNPTTTTMGSVVTSANSGAGLIDVTGPWR